MISGVQARTARKLLGWTLEEVATRMIVGDNIMFAFERRKRLPLALDRTKLRLAFEAAGVEFTDADLGVKLRATR
jgi:transcriptional regulator with XRE-family HTH domain